MAYDFSKLTKGIADTRVWLESELAGVRTGRASPALLDSIRPEAYGTRTPLTQLGSVSIEDARTLRVIPWDKSLTKAIEKAIAEANLGVSASVDDMGLRVIFPELTSERRTMLTKLAGERLEAAKVTLRSHRTDALHDLERAEKEGGMGADELKRLKEDVQKQIDAAQAALAALAKKKEEEIAN
jgi:ribosome recycling factor